MPGLRAFEVGMVSHCVPAAELDQKVEEIAARIAGAGIHALRATKSLLNELDGAALAAMVRKGAEISARIVEGAEARGMLGKKLGI
jgi:hypothetical protein